MNAAEVKNGYEAFQAHEARDSMYKTATFLVNTFWGQPQKMADGLGVLLLTWNNAFYRYGFFDFDVLEGCIRDKQETLENYRNRNILDYKSSDNKSINELYSDFLNALQIASGKAVGRKSHVAVAKALHLLAPGFFPLWDDKIAKAYNCHYDYIPFMQEMKKLAQILDPEVDAESTGKTLLKLIDEYNYAKFTKQWV
jgi:hypothetical protein